MSEAYTSEAYTSLSGPKLFNIQSNYLPNEKMRLAEILGISKQVYSNELKKITKKNCISIKKFKNNLRKSVQHKKAGDVNPLPTFSTQKWLQTRYVHPSVSNQSLSLKKLAKVPGKHQKSRNMGNFGSIVSDMLKKASLDPAKMVKSTITGSITDDGDFVYS
jgi:hypothetical protein